ncbi:MAG: cupin domain-containing protein [Nanoarchaeota archaeon]
MKKTISTVDELNEIINGEWNDVTLFTLTEEMKEVLLASPMVDKEYMTFNKNTVWENHAHTRAQLLLVIAGRLTHVVRGDEFMQEPNDLLIVPKNLVHRAFSGKSKPLLVYVFYKK